MPLSGGSGQLLVQALGRLRQIVLDTEPQAKHGVSLDDHGDEIDSQRLLRMVAGCLEHCCALLEGRCTPGQFVAGCEAVTEGRVDVGVGALVKRAASEQADGTPLAKRARNLAGDPAPPDQPVE